MVLFKIRGGNPKKGIRLINVTHKNDKRKI